MAREALELVRGASSEKLSRAMREVERAIGRAVDGVRPNPDEDCPNISNRTKELLDTLRQPGINQITMDEFRRYMDQLIKIAQMG